MIWVCSDPLCYPLWWSLTFAMASEHPFTSTEVIAAQKTRITMKIKKKLQALHQDDRGEIMPCISTTITIPESMLCTFRGNTAKTDASALARSSISPTLYFCARSEQYERLEKFLAVWMHHKNKIVSLRTAATQKTRSLYNDVKGSGGGKPFSACPS